MTRQLLVNESRTFALSQQQNQPWSESPKFNAIVGYASKINNAAAVALQKGDHNIAIAELTIALKTLSKRLRCMDTHSKCSIEGANTPPQPILLGFVPEIVDCNAESNQGCIDRFVFRNPMCIQNTEAFQPSCSTFETLSYVVIYNLALAWQLSGIAADDDESRTVKLRKALKLYEHSNKILANGKVAIDLLQHMAVLCNMGAIYDFFKDARAAACQESLLSAAMYCIDTGYQRPELGETLQGLLSNAMPITAITAPAA